MTSDDLGWPLMASDDFRAGVAQESLVISGHQRSSAGFAQESLGRADEGSMRRGAPARKRLHAARHDTTPLSKRRRRWGRTVEPWVRGTGGRTGGPGGGRSSVEARRAGPEETWSTHLPLVNE